MKELIKSNGHTLDRLSELPDSLILEILSLLKMRDVVRTTLLSKRWKYLWITIPCLQFEVREVHFGDISSKIRNFVNRVLALWGGTYLRKFSIYFHNYYFWGSSSSDIEFWVHFAKNKKVEELYIGYYCHGPRYRPPQWLYECSSLRKLRLAGCDLKIRGNVQWDRLNSLHLSSCLLYEDAIEQVFSSPQLETFISYYNEGFQNLRIRSSSLKKLSICTRSFKDGMLIIWAPNVEALKISGIPFSTYLLTDIRSLTDVDLNFFNYRDPYLYEALCQIRPAIQHAAAVKVSDACLKMLMTDEYSFPPFSNVNLLRNGISVTKLSQLLHFLELFPKLKMLLLDWVEDSGELWKLNAKKSEANILKSKLLQLRTVEITFYSYKASLMLKFIEFLLKHATMIEKIVIRKGKCSVVESEDVFLVARQVMSLKRSFPSAKLIFLW